MSKIWLVLTTLLSAFLIGGAGMKGSGYPFELYRVAASSGDAEFLLYTVHFQQDEKLLDCKDAGEDRPWNCDEQIARLDDWRKKLERIRELVRLHLDFVKVEVTAEGYASVERKSETIVNLRIASQRAQWVHAYLSGAVPTESPPLDKFKIEPILKGVYIHRAWRDDLMAVVGSKRFWKDGRPVTVDEVAGAASNRCRDGFGLEMEARDQDPLQTRVGRRPSYDAELREGRRVEIWLRTNSQTIRNLINPKHSPPCGG